MIVIMEEGNHHHLRWLDCDMFVPWAALNYRHPTTALCAQGVDRKMWRLEEEEAQAGEAMALQAYGRPLEIVTSLKYLGCLITVTSDNWPVLREYTSTQVHGLIPVSSEYTSMQVHRLIPAQMMVYN